jgi:hypothetical protein
MTKTPASGASSEDDTVPPFGRSEDSFEPPSDEDESKGYEWPEDQDVPEGYVRCDDGLIYKHRIVGGVVGIVMTSSTHPGSLKRAERIEAAIHSAIMKAVSEGVQVGSPELTAVIDAARNAAMEE